MAEIVIVAQKDGTVSVKAEGYQGPSCALATAPYIRALGLRAGEHQLPEMFAQQSSQQQVTQ